MNIFRLYKLGVRALVMSVALFTSVTLWGLGWTPTDAGFVLNFETGDQFLLSVWIDVDGDGVEDPGEEFFVCDYPSYNKGYFNYEAKDYMKLIPQVTGATEPSPASVWTIGDKLKRILNKKDYSLGGICYTMWGNSGKTLVTAPGSDFKFLGDLTDNEKDPNLSETLDNQ